MVHIQNQVPPHRRTEVIGSLGSSGFIGMTLGTQLGDGIFHAFADGRPRFLALFGVATVLGMLYFAIVVFLTRNDVHERPQETPAAHRLILRYWPGNVVYVAVMMGIAFTVTTVFLTRFATERGLGGIGTFFTAFAVSAFTFRIAGRRWSRSIGRHRLIVLGLAGHGMGLGLLSFVTSEWHFIIPAIGSGFGHALLFPSVLSLGAGTFPQQYRGTGTTILLGFTEVGAILSAPLLGGMIDRYGFSPMFTVTAGMSLLLAAVYALTDARKPDDDIRGDRPRPSDEHEHLSRRHTPISPPSKRDDSIAVPFPHVGRSA